jgi:glycosyltransferase involved in cell wall biosynthesis
MERGEVAIVIPAFNEEASIAKVIRGVKAFAQPIVVSDGSTDRTAALAAEGGALVVDLPKNVGYERAIEAGFAEAKRRGFQSVITFDADGQHPAQTLPEMIQGLTKNPLVLGVRSQKARFAERLFGIWTNQRFGIRDPLCGLKGYSLENYGRIGFFDSYGSIGTELMLRIVASGAAFSQVEFHVQEREGHSRFGRFLRGNWKILRALAFSIRRF